MKKKWKLFCSSQNNLLMAVDVVWILQHLDAVFLIMWSKNLTFQTIEQTKAHKFKTKPKKRKLKGWELLLALESEMVRFILSYSILE